MDRMREHSPTLVDQALLVSHELIRVAILWHELWHEGLEEASRLYFTENNPEGMIAVLAPLHDMIEAVSIDRYPGQSNQLITCLQGPTTTRETSFVQVFGRDLAEAREACRRFQIYGDTADLNKAWDIYYQVWVSSARLSHLFTHEPHT
jgi:FKBP12-rapamycin complex-associated protein